MRKRGAEPCPRVEEGRRKRDLDRGVNLTATRARRVELESDSQVMRSGLCWTWRMRIEGFSDCYCASAAERCKVAAISLDYCKPAASAVYVDCQSGMLCWIIP